MTAGKGSRKSSAPELSRIERAQRKLNNARRRMKQDRFTRRLQDKDLPLSLDMRGESRALLITFGGMVRYTGIPPFEFFRATRDIPTKRLFVRDMRQAWYHKGIEGYGDTLMETADALRELIAGYEVERLVTAGTSAGGYGALAFGTLLGAHTVLSFAPQTVIAPELIAAMGDHRWDEPLQALDAAGALDREWTDLRDALPRTRHSAVRYEVYFCQNNSEPNVGPGRDRLHAERLRGLDGLRLYRFGRGGHLVVRTLREAGALHKILRRALLSEDANLPPEQRSAIHSG